MKFRLGKSESASKGIARINRELCEHAAGMTGSSNVLTEDTVFELRKTVKKLRAVLRISRPALGNSAYRELDRRMRDFAREQGLLRDSAVLIETLDALLEHFKPFPDEIAMQTVRNALHCRYELALEDFLQANEEISLTMRFNDIEQRVRDLDLRRVSRAMLLEGIGKTYRRCRTGLQKLHEIPSTENSHDLRRQVKYAWNQLRLIRRWQSGGFKPLIAGLDRLGDLLGQDSDLAMLAGTVQRHPELCCNRIRAEFVLALVEARRVVLLTASLRLADRLFAEPPDKFARWLKHGGGGKLR
ncbi:MAG: CHAD domain-containing protein [Gammaproteobacteria bacterium]